MLHGRFLLVHDESLLLSLLHLLPFRSTPASSMKFTRGLSTVHGLGFWVLFSSLVSITVASNDCAASTWQPGQFKRDVTSTSSRSTSSTGTVLSSSTVSTSTAAPAVTTVVISPLVTSGNVGVGKVNCRYAANTEGMSINYYTCTELAQDYGINVETFFKLNPTVLPDCSNIKANTDYCVAGCKSRASLCFGKSHSWKLITYSSKQSLSHSDPTMVSAVHHTTMPHAWAQLSSVATPILGLVAIRRESILRTRYNSYHFA